MGHLNKKTPLFSTRENTKFPKWKIKLEILEKHVTIIVHGGGFMIVNDSKKKEESRESDFVFIENVGSCLDYLGITKSDFAASLDWSLPKYSKTFGAKRSRSLSFDEAHEVAKHLGFGIDDLLDPEFDPAQTSPRGKLKSLKATKRLSHCLDDAITFRGNWKKLEETFHVDYPKAIRMVLNLHTEEYAVEGHMNRIQSRMIRGTGKGDRLISTYRPYVYVKYKGLVSRTNDELIFGYWFDEGNRYMTLSICYMPEKDKFSDYGIRKRRYYKSMLANPNSGSFDVEAALVAKNLVAGEIFTKLYNFDGSMDLSDETLGKDLREVFEIYKSLLVKASDSANEVFWKAYDAVATEDEAKVGDLNEIIVESATESIARRSNMPMLRREVIDEAGYCCEICGRKETFEGKDGKQYFEVSHIIPFRKCLPEWNPDVKSNLICVCPQCNRLLDFANRGMREEKIVELYYKRKEALKKDGIDISLSDMLKMHNL